MTWNLATMWWLAAGLLVAAELASGSFYLLMLAVGAAAGAASAHLGLGPTVQIVIAAAVGCVATLLWHLRRGRGGNAASTDQAAQLDIGQRLHVPAWQADGSARVPYRGATWSVQYQGPGVALPGEHVIVALDGNRLLVVPFSVSSPSAPTAPLQR